MKQVFTLNVYKLLITTALITTSFNIFAAQSNWIKVGETPSGKPVMLSPTGKQFISPNYEPFGGNYRGTSNTSFLIVGSNGAVSAKAVPAVIKHQLPKKTVMAKILQQARTGGKTLGRFLVGNSPYGRAFNLALGALALSKYFWSDEKGDFVKPKDDNTYVVVATGKNSSVYSSGANVDDKFLDEVCQKYNLECNIIGYYQGIDNAYNQALNYCKSQSFEISAGKSANFNQIGWSGFCTRDGFYQSSTRAVKIFKYVDFVPITLDEFIDEATPEADSNPNDWVETSGVQPTDEPTVIVPAGTVAQTNPYTDPKDGKVKQTRWDFDPNGKVRETEIPRPDLTPDSPEAPRLDPPKQDGDTTETGDKDKPKDGEAEKDKDKEKSDTQDLCEKNPNVLACDKQPEKPELDDFPEIPTETVNLKFSPDNVFPSQAVCPADVSFVVFDKTYAFSLKPACDLAQSMRAFIIATAFLMAAFFVVRTVQSEV